MPLQENIKKITSLNWTDNNAHFLRLQGLSRAEKDRKMNMKKVKQPRNIHLVENCDISINDNSDNIVTKEIDLHFDKYEISAAIKEVHGGADLSNKHWEEYWAKHLKDSSIERETKKSAEHANAKMHESKITENHSRDKDKIQKNIHPDAINYLINRLHKNAAIMSLVKMKKMSIEEIIDPSSAYVRNTENKVNTSHKASDLNDVMHNASYQIEAISLPDEPEVYVHPFQLGLDKQKFNHIDFSVPRLGKKVKETPLEFFLKENNDEYFDFVKKKKKNGT